MAYALCAFLRPNLHLSNPGVMTSVFPPFWNMYNTLPVPVLKRNRQEKEDEDAKPVRRRVIAHGVYGELPPEPTAGEDF
jgi:3-phosphoshikimate 1-carboxyvinyltransferase